MRDEVCLARLKCIIQMQNLAAQKKKKPAHVFHQHLQICTAFIMIIKRNSQRDHALKRETSHVAVTIFTRQS